MKKREQLRKIVQQLLDLGRFRYTRQDLDDAVLRGLMVTDQRTFDRWFNLLWKLEFLLQPERGVYVLNVERVVQLEVNLPCEVDPAQRRLNSE